MGTREHESDSGNPMGSNPTSIFILSQSVNAKNKHIKLTLTKCHSLNYEPGCASYTKRKAHNVETKQRNPMVNCLGDRAIICCGN